MAGDGLVRPLNAPPGITPAPGVQPGSTAVTIAHYVIVFGAGGGVFVYSGTPAKGNPPIASITGGSIDPYGNTVETGIASNGTGAAAGDNIVMFGNGLAFNSAAGASTVITVSGNLVTVTSEGADASIWQFTLPVEMTDGASVTGGLTVDTAVLAGGAAPSASSGNAELYSDASGDAREVTSSGQSGALVLSQTSTATKTSGNVTTQTDITAAYTLNSAVVGTVAEVATDFNGTWGGQLLTFYADINGSFTQVGLPVGAVFGSGVASGDAVSGWCRMVFRVVSATAVRVHLEGAIFDSTQNSGHISTSTQVNLGGTDVTGVTFAAGDTLAIAIAFGGSTTGQTIITEGSDFTVKLP
jgi:hypothetical protein